jgi:hypothetical protein
VTDARASFVCMHTKRQAIWRELMDAIAAAAVADA